MELKGSVLEHVLLDRIINGVEEDIIYRGKVAGKRIRHSDSLLATGLAAYSPKKFGTADQKAKLEEAKEQKMLLDLDILDEEDRATFIRCYKQLKDHQDNVHEAQIESKTQTLLEKKIEQLGGLETNARPARPDKKLLSKLNED